MALAFYKNAELGDSSDTGRYSVDVISSVGGDGYGYYGGTNTNGNEETNQFNGRVAYTFDHGDFGSTEIGLSGQWGQLYNNETKDTGDHWAGAVHLVGNYGRWNVQLEGIQYEYDPENPVGTSDDAIVMGGYNYAWGTPAEATIGTFNVAYGLPVNLGPISKLTFYSDNTVIEPEEDYMATIWQNVVGTMITSGPLYTYIDIISGKNMIFAGGNMVNDEDGHRKTRLNINFGYYF